jgi:hypothetical protein
LQLALDLADANAVKESAVGAAQVADDPALLGVQDLGVAAADGGIGQGDFGDGRTPDAKQLTALPLMLFKIWTDTVKANPWASHRGLRDGTLTDGVLAGETFLRR